MKRLTPTTDQYQAIKTIARTTSGAALCTAGLGAGKAQPLSELVLTPHGYVTMGDISVGDLVIGSDGKPTEVLGVYPQGVKEIVEFTLSDGTTVRSTWDHLWTIRRKPGQWRTLTTKDIAAVLDREGVRGIFLPLVEPVEFSPVENELLIDPYTLGVLLGDGSLAHMVSLNTDVEIKESLVLPDGAEFGENRGKSTPDYNGEWYIRGIRPQLDAYGLRVRSENKHVPKDYLWGSIETRKAVLAGLLDTDGSVDKVAIEYGTVSESLARDVEFLVRSLGGTCVTTTKEPTYTYRGETRQGQKFYRMRLRLPFNPFRVNRKRNALREWDKYPLKRVIRSYRVVGMEEAQCISVSSPDHLYVTSNFTLTHNTLTAVEVVRERDPRTVVVVCPLGTRVGWEQTFKRQGIDLPVHRVDSTKRGKEALASLLADEAGVYLIGREYVRRLPTEKMRPDMCIVDEVHFMQNKDSVSFKKMMRMKAGFRLGLSGTPFRNKFEGAWAVTRWLWPTEVDRSFWRWAVQWCRTIYDVWSYNNKKIVGERVPGAYVAQLPCYVQFETKVGEAVTEYRYVDLTPAQRKMYEQMEANGLAWLQENPLVADLPIVQRVRLRQMTLGTVTFDEDGSIGFEDDCKSSKIDALKEILADLEGEPVLILTDSQRFAEVVTKRLGAKAREWSGKVSHAERETLRRDFGKNFQWLVATIASCAEGIDGWQYVCANVVWLSKAEDGIMNQQALGRLVRTGQTRQVTSYEIIANDTYDTGQLSKLLEQELEMRKVLRGRD